MNRAQYEVNLMREVQRYRVCNRCSFGQAVPAPGDLFERVEPVERERCDICRSFDEVAGRTLNQRAICPECLAKMYAGSIHRTAISTNERGH